MDSATASQQNLNLSGEIEGSILNLIRRIAAKELPTTEELGILVDLAKFLLEHRGGYS
jgi:hypothetical protein